MVTENFKNGLSSCHGIAMSGTWEVLSKHQPPPTYPQPSPPQDLSATLLGVVFDIILPIPVLFCYLTFSCNLVMVLLGSNFHRINLSSYLKFCLEVVKAKQQKANEENRMYLFCRTKAPFIFLSSIEFCVHMKSCFRAIVESTRCPLGSHDLGTQSPGPFHQTCSTVGLC